MYQEKGNPSKDIRNNRSELAGVAVKSAILIGIGCGLRAIAPHYSSESDQYLVLNVSGYITSDIGILLAATEATRHLGRLMNARQTRRTHMND